MEKSFRKYVPKDNPRSRFNFGKKQKKKKKNTECKKLFWNYDTLKEGY